MLACAPDMQHRQALVSLLSTLTPALSGHAQLLEQLQDTQLGLDTLSHVPQPWTDRLAHLVSKFLALRPSKCIMIFLGASRPCSGMILFMILFLLAFFWRSWRGTHCGTRRCTVPQEQSKAKSILSIEVLALGGAHDHNCSQMLLQVRESFVSA